MLTRTVRTLNSTAAPYLMITLTKKKQQQTVLLYIIDTKENKQTNRDRP